MEETVGRIAIIAFEIIGGLGVTVGLLWGTLWLIGKLIKVLGYWGMFYKTMMKMAQNGEFKRGKRTK